MDDYDLEDFICPICANEGTKSSQCSECGGEGCFDDSDEDYCIEGTVLNPCMNCHGTGRIRWCASCGKDLTGRSDLVDPSDPYS